MLERPIAQGTANILWNYKSSWSWLLKPHTGTNGHYLIFVSLFITYTVLYQFCSLFKTRFYNHMNFSYSRRKSLLWPISIYTGIWCLNLNISVVSARNVDKVVAPVLRSRLESENFGIDSNWSSHLFGRHVEQQKILYVMYPTLALSLGPTLENPSLSISVFALSIRG
jgi:hypothetical protein